MEDEKDGLVVLDIELLADMKLVLSEKFGVEPNVA